MSTDAWIEEHWIGEAILPRPRRAPKLPALPVPHAPTCSRGNAALAAHAQSRDSARHPGDRLSARQDGRNVVDQQARKLTQPSSSDRLPIHRSESPTGYSSAGCSPAEPASASPVTDNSSPNPIQRANQIALLNSTAGCRQTRAPRPNGECHLYFARRVTFLSCADTDVERTSSICGNDLPKLTNSTSMSRAAKQS